MLTELDPALQEATALMKIAVVLADLIANVNWPKLT